MVIFWVYFVPCPSHVLIKHWVHNVITHLALRNRVTYMHMAMLATMEENKQILRPTFSQPRGSAVMRITWSASNGTRPIRPKSQENTHMEHWSKYVKINNAMGWLSERKTVLNSPGKRTLLLAIIWILLLSGKYLATNSLTPRRTWWISTSASRTPFDT